LLPRRRGLLARIVTLGLQLAGFLRGGSPGSVMGLYRLGGLLLDLFNAGLSTRHPLGARFQFCGQHSSLLLGSSAAVLRFRQCGTQPLDLGSLLTLTLGLRFDLQTGSRQLYSRRLRRLLFALDPLCLVSQISGLLFSFTRQGVTLTGQLGYQLAQRIAFRFDCLACSSQFRAFA
jgi:hypothetical protein